MDDPGAMTARDGCTRTARTRRPEPTGAPRPRPGLEFDVRTLGWRAVRHWGCSAWRRWRALAGCIRRLVSGAPAGTATPSTAATSGRPERDRPAHGSGTPGRRHAGARRDARAVPRRRQQRRRTCSTTPASSVRTSAPRSAPRRRRLAAGAADGRTSPSPTPANGYRASAGPWRVYAWHCDAAGPLLDVLARASRTRTTCAASSRPTRRARRASRRSSPAATTGAGRTSTSRSTAATAEATSDGPDRQDQPDRAARGGLQGGLRRRAGYPSEPRQPRAHLADRRHGLRRRRRRSTSSRR